MAVPPSVPGGNLPHSKDSVLCSFLLLLFLPVPRLRFPLILSNGFRLYCILYHIRAPLARGESKKVGWGAFLGGQLTLPLRCRGGLPGWSLADLAAAVPGGGVLSLSPACPAFSLLPCPLSPRPALAERSSPVGKGGFKVISCKGLRPRHPGTEPPAALTDLFKHESGGGLARLVACRPCHRCTRRGAEPQRHLFALPRGRGPSQTPPSLATDSSISPGPPLSLAAGTDHRKVVLPVLRRNAGSPMHWAPAWQGL